MNRNRSFKLLVTFAVLVAVILAVGMATASQPGKAAVSGEENAQLEQQSRDAIYTRWWAIAQAFANRRPTPRADDNRTCGLLCGGR